MSEEEPSPVSANIRVPRPVSFSSNLQIKVPDRIPQKKTVSKETSNTIPLAPLDLSEKTAISNATAIPNMQISIQKPSTPPPQIKPSSPPTRLQLSPAFPSTTEVNPSQTDTPVGPPNAFKTYIYSQFQALNLGNSEIEICYKYLFENYLRSKAALGELSEIEFKKFLEEDQSNQLLNRGLKMNLVAVHRAIRSDYLKSSPFQREEIQRKDTQSSMPDNISLTNEFSGELNLNIIKSSQMDCHIEATKENDTVESCHDFKEAHDEAVKINEAVENNSDLLKGPETKSNGENQPDQIEINPISASKFQLRDRIQRRMSSSMASNSSKLMSPQRKSLGAQGPGQEVISQEELNSLLTKNEDNEVLKNQIKELGVQPLQFIPLKDIRKEMDELMARLNRGESFDETRFDYLLRCMNVNSDYKKEKEAEAAKWRDEVDPIFLGWYVEMKKFIPKNINQFSIQNLVSFGKNVFTHQIISIFLYNY